MLGRSTEGTANFRDNILLRTSGLPIPSWSLLQQYFPQSYSSQVAHLVRVTASTTSGGGTNCKNDLQNFLWLSLPKTNNK